jgi:hypothetical protein
MSVFNATFLELSFYVFLAFIVWTHGIRRHDIKDNWRIESINHVVIFSFIIFAYCYVFSSTRSSSTTSVH